MRLDQQGAAEKVDKEIENVKKNPKSVKAWVKLVSAIAGLVISIIVVLKRIGVMKFLFFIREWVFKPKARHGAW